MLLGSTDYNVLSVGLRGQSGPANGTLITIAIRYFVHAQRPVAHAVYELPVLPQGFSQGKL
jgi:hypothetical protein